MSRAHVFRLFPERGSLFVRAVVHPTKKAMREDFFAGPACEREGFGRRLGYCREIHVLNIGPGGCRRDPCIAEVHLFRARISTEIVTHELFHATMAWGRRIRFPFRRLDAEDSVNADEERMTYVHGRLCSEFVHRAYEVGLYP